MKRALVISHPAVLPANQVVYERLAEYGWSVHLVVPATWEHEYSEGPFRAEFADSLRENSRPVPVLGRGHPQRHIYRDLPGRILRDVSPDLVFLEQEPFALVTGQWLPSLVRAKVPFGLQQDENLHRPLPHVARLIQKRALARAAFVAARSPRAAQLVGETHPALFRPVIPHTIMEWPVPAGGARRQQGAFTVGYAGRLIEEKGLRDLLAATSAMQHPTRLLCFGDGPLRAELEAASTPERPVEVATGVTHAHMDEAYGQMDVLALPSRTTRTWAEQFGRVLVEAMSCGRPVVGSDSGEIPWVIGTAGGGVTFPEGDVQALADRLDSLAASPALWSDLSARGMQGVAEHFSASAAARMTSEAFDRVLSG